MGVAELPSSGMVPRSWRGGVADSPHLLLGAAMDYQLPCWLSEYCSYGNFSIVLAVIQDLSWWMMDLLRVLYKVYLQR